MSRQLTPLVKSTRKIGTAYVDWTGKTAGGWDDMLWEILNGRLNVFPNKKRTACDTEDNVDDEDDKEMPEETETPKIYEASEQDGRYVPIRTNREEDALQIHTNGEISGEHLETQIRPSNRNSKKPNRYDGTLYWKLLWLKLKMSNEYQMFYWYSVE